MCRLYSYMITSKAKINFPNKLQFLEDILENEKKLYPRFALELTSVSEEMAESNSCSNSSSVH